MWEKVVAVVLVVGAVVGLWWSIRKQRRQRCEGSSGCGRCPLATKCTKPEKRL